MSSYYFFPQRLYTALPRLRPLVWRVEHGIVVLALWLLRLLPLSLAMRACGRCFAAFGPRTSRARKVRGNLAVAYPDRSADEIDRLTAHTFRHLGVALVELAQLPKIWRERDKRIEFVEMPGATRPSPERRTVFVTAHVGAWQLTPLVGPEYGVTIPVIHAPESNPHVDALLTDLRKAFGNPLVSRDGGVRVLIRALEQGNSIGMTMDTRLDGGEPVPFFGEEAPTNTIPARLALRYGCDLVPALAERLPGARFRVILYPPVRPRDESASTAAQIRDMTRQVNGLFEEWIRQRPGEWLCMKRRWPREVSRKYPALSRGCEPS